MIWQQQNQNTTAGKNNKQLIEKALERKYVLSHKKKEKKHILKTF